jgi:hypothetical protein
MLFLYLDLRMGELLTVKSQNVLWKLELLETLMSNSNN